MIPQQIGWEATPVPKRKTRPSGLWDELIPAKLIQEMRLNPGVDYQLMDTKRGEPLELLPADIQALQRSVRRPYRIQTRSADPESKTKVRHVWVSNAPGYWLRVDELREKRK